MKNEITDDCMIPIINQTVALVYNKKLYGDKPPTSITDFFNSNYPGQRITFNYWTGSAEPLALAAGIPANKVYPIDWAKLKTAVTDANKTAKITEKPPTEPQLADWIDQAKKLPQVVEAK